MEATHRRLLAISRIVTKFFLSSSYSNTPEGLGLNARSDTMLYTVSLLSPTGGIRTPNTYLKVRAFQARAFTYFRHS